MGKGMENTCAKWLQDGMCGVLPSYGEYGVNGSAIIFEDGSSIEHKRKVRSVIIELAGLFQKDIVLLRKQSNDVLSQKTMTPLSIAPGIIVVPFKMRKPVGKDDGTAGYVFESHVDGIEEAKEGSILRLKCGRRLAVMEGAKTATRHMDNAMRLKNNTVHYSAKNDQTAASWLKLREEYEQPATRGDIAIVHRSLMCIMEKLKL